MSDTVPPDRYQAYLSALLAGQKDRCQGILEELLDDLQIPLIALFLELIRKSMYAVGALWEQDRISVSTEHVATSVTESLLLWLYPRLLRTPRIGKRIVISCLPGERHRVGAHIAADILTLDGWQTHFLGAGASAEEILREMEEQKPHLFGISMSIPSNYRQLEVLLRAVARNFSEIPVVLGGQAFGPGMAGILNDFPDARIAPDASQLADFSRSLLH